MYYFLTNGYLKQFNLIYHSTINYNSYEIYKIFVLGII